MIKQYELKTYRLDRGKHCFISRGRLNTLIATKYGRDPEKTCLKIFDKVYITDKDNAAKMDHFDPTAINWGDEPASSDKPNMLVNLLEATQIQNICAYHGLAPRVFGIETVEIGDRVFPMQLCEYVSGKDSDPKDAYDLVKATGQVYGFANDKDDYSSDDVIDGKLVDFNTFHFVSSYKDFVKKVYIRDGIYGKVYYQNIDELGLRGGPRKGDQRAEWMKLHEFDFRDKSVLDVGCAGGYFCRYARHAGARTVVGLDIFPSIYAAWHAANFAGFFNIDFFESGTDGDFKLPNQLIKRDYFQEVPVNKFDVIFFLSMYMHIGLPEELFNHMHKDTIMYFEKNGRDSDVQVEEMLKSKFHSVKLIAYGHDHGDKPIYLCQRPI